MFLLLYPFSIIEDMQQYLPQSFSIFTLFFTVSPKHIFTLFFSKITIRTPGPPRQTVSHMYHNITKKHFYSILSKNHQRDSGSATSHVYHSITKTHFYPIFFKNHHRDPEPATSDCITCVSQYHKNTFLLNFI